MAHDRHGVLKEQRGTEGFGVSWTALDKSRGVSGPVTPDGFYGPVAAADGRPIRAGLYTLAEDGQPPREVAVVKTYDSATFISTIDDQKRRP